MKVRIKKLSESAVIPAKAHKTDAGFDLVATREWYDENGCICYGTDLAFEIPEGYMGLVFPRSSISKKELSLNNAVGVIDSCYRGEVTLKFKLLWSYDSKGDGVYVNDSGSTIRKYSVGERVGQLIIMPIPEIEFEEADELTETDRGEGGYGSTGR